MAFSNAEHAVIVTGRFQPLHKGHVAFWRRIRDRYDHHLIICVLRTRPFSPAASTMPTHYSSNRFERLSMLVHVTEKNPLPNWERLRLVTLAIENDPNLKGNTTVILRDRPDLYWEQSLQDLPSSRTWVFATRRSELDKSKPEFYKSKGESIITLEDDTITEFEGEAIRRQLRTGPTDLTFLPDGCMDYFTNYCLPYIVPQAEKAH